MFSQPLNEQSQSTLIQNNPRRLRKKKKSNKNKQKEFIKKKQSQFQMTMSTWADNFITAATWQMKHQIAYWKSKAKALEYENRILHEIIRKNSVSTTVGDIKTYESTVNNNSSDIEDEEEHEEENFEVSEEFIEFLRTNAKFKENARKERERLQRKIKDEENEKMEEELTKNKESCAENLKELYGKDWQRISALEIAMQCDYIEQTDNCNPLYWPNIPLNFSYV